MPATAWVGEAYHPSPPAASVTLSVIVRATWLPNPYGHCRVDIGAGYTYLIPQKIKRPHGI